MFPNHASSSRSNSSSLTKSFASGRSFGRSLRVVGSAFSGKRATSIDWWCVARFDDPPLFGRLVGGDEAGTFSIGPHEDAHVLRRAYRPGTVTLTTTWSLDGGELELADSLIAEVEGRFLPGTLLVRQLTTRGRAVRAQLHFAPRFGYDRSPPARTGRRAGALVCEGAGLAVANGLPYVEGLRSITSAPAKIWSVDDRSGTLAPGMEADLVLWDGDPLEPSTLPTAVLVQGREVSLVTHQSRLRDRYLPLLPRS